MQEKINAHTLARESLQNSPEVSSFPFHKNLATVPSAKRRWNDINVENLLDNQSSSTPLNLLLPQGSIVPNVTGQRLKTGGIFGVIGEIRTNSSSG